MLIPSLRLSLSRDQQTHLFWTWIKILPILSTLKPLSDLQALNGAWTIISQEPRPWWHVNHKKSSTDRSNQASIYLFIGLFVWVCLCVDLSVWMFLCVGVFVCIWGKRRWGKESHWIHCAWKREKKRCKCEINKIINTHVIVIMHTYTVTVAIVYLYTSLHPLIWVIFCSNCVKVVTFFHFAHLCTNWCNCSNSHPRVIFSVNLDKF